MDPQTLTYYQNHAVEVARRYESADPTLIHENLLRAFSIAILMHIPKELVDSSLLELARVIRPGGQFLFSIPALRKDPIVDDRDTDGRLFTTLDPTDWIDTASRAGFSLIETMLDTDCLNRSGFSWQTFLFSR